MCEIGELVDSNGVGVGGVGVMFLDLDEIAKEDSFAVFSFSFFGV